jgi:bifunctional UDP-N-acetylglucosamine pyrophosphorylase/glucosamine-1-phosphate N-acetyltransferase
MKAKTAFILAFQEDAAMNSARHTALHEVCFRPMLGYVLDAVQQVAERKPVVLTGFDAERVEAFLGERADFVRIDAAAQAAAAFSYAIRETGQGSGYALIISGCAPLIKKETLSKLVEAANGNAASALIAKCDGEDEDAEAQKCLVCCVDMAFLKEAAGSIDAILESVRQNGFKVINVFASEYECIGVRDRASLWECNYLMNSFLVARHLDAGVTMLDPTKILVGSEVKIGRDTIIYPNVTLSGKTQIGENCVLYDGCRLKDTAVGNNCTLQSVVANETEIGNAVTAGPFVHLRPNTKIMDGCKVGDFVEVKNSTVGVGTKMPHLSYIGDADVGARVNVGCGCVFVNYDGYKKHRTVVGDDVFLGCQTNLVAPVTVGDGAYTAAGSTVIEDVPAGALAVARAYQVNKPGWVAKNREKNRGK